MEKQSETSSPPQDLKRVVTMAGDVCLRNYTVRDIRDLKGKKQLTQILAFTPDEAAAAEAAGIDLINVRWNPLDPRESFAICNAAPRTFTTFCMPLTLCTSEQEALRIGFEAMEGGGDGIYCAWSLKFIEAMAKAGIPVQGHAGLVPRRSTWTGGLRAVGKTVAEAESIFNDFKNLEQAGAWSVECEVIPHRILSELTKRTSLVTVSLGSGDGGDVQFLFAQDILGDGPGPFPRHAKIYRDFHKMRQDMQKERIAAFSEFAADIRSGEYPAPENIVEIDDAVIEEFLARHPLPG
ncbi:3-methyl-2-oxobutanoate hydroxymethyltransferase [Sneathiella sp. CAU 1612]|uniref:3-methyl-2-oxobutanoate hydroxymethyltransferase n=1 Tax=Sneathiella sedimenti TaxID=2816034 RepID=A0ABS3F4X5_9PROT|nr:3-methyl-2-oxobutanoate hydroxymethyltransferase [Sneathiella sedimenti]MBO0333176.1 3-methyl-2-oxobutanoate hydroxymethyltransferase [Sneathiella sedimenti]